AKTASRMFIRLAASIRSELIAIDIRERQQQEERRLHWGAAITVLSLIAVPIGFLGAYFGVNAREVNNDWSIFDMSHHQLAYIAAGCLALIPFITFLALNGHAWLANRREKSSEKCTCEHYLAVESGMWRTAMPEVGCGAAPATRRRGASRSSRATGPIMTLPVGRYCVPGHTACPATQRGKQ
ncbi:MAG: hypothetical protein ACREX8_12755, partial [Gammaproteobacteria bacterium]